jgi:hypothetical protein
VGAAAEFPQHARRRDAFFVARATPDGRLRPAGTADDVMVLRRSNRLRDLLQRGLQDHTNRGFTRHFAGLIGDYAPVGRE